ncbi:MAG TPA: gliding motility protein GldM [Bacteroidetes bacterium]|nr:gliding motility protein GldM [Bacteroidota bacterium]
MAHGKETPRQKMIGMMYLVLTSLLALNVSKEAVEAFKLVDESLTETTKINVERNKLVYDDFNSKAASNPQKAGPWRDKALQVKQRADEMFNYIQNLKLEIIRTAEGKNSEAIKGKNIIVENIHKIDENNVPSQIMIGANMNGKAYDLHHALDEYRDFLLQIIGNKDNNVSEAIKRTLDTSDATDPGGEKVTWEIHNFHTLPLIAVITILSKLQSDIRNTEGQILNYLYGQIEAKDFKVNKLEAFVSARSNYVMEGGNYHAEVFIAATDTTTTPQVLVGPYKKVTNPDGTFNYVMTGRYQELPVNKSGRGIYEIPANSTGEKVWGGLIRIKSPSGDTIAFPFQEKYTVAAPNVVVSPTAMNVFYVGVDNPVDISVPGVGSDKISASMTNGIIKRGKTKKFRGSWIVRPKVPGKTALVRVTANVNEKNISFPGIPFRVKRVPDPVAKIAGKKGGPINKASLAAQSVVLAEMENFDFDLKFKVTSFRMSVVIKGFTYDETSSSNRLTPKQKGFINQMRRGQRVIFDDIKAVGPDNTTRELNPIIFTIQ